MTDKKKSITPKQLARRVKSGEKYMPLTIPQAETADSLGEDLFVGIDSMGNDALYVHCSKGIALIHKDGSISWQR